MRRDPDVSVKSSSLYYLRPGQVVRAPGAQILSYVLAKTEPGVPPETVARRITATTGLGAMSSDEFMRKTIDYYLRYTGIPFNFGITALLGFLVGTAIAGQTFYNFTIENLKQFGA